jgi:Ran GTPase-activating protein (RanGAP) involved in mRNA processing and transport
LKTNKTVEVIYMGNLMVGCTVRLKCSGEEKVVTDLNSNGIHIKVLGVTDWTNEYDPIPAVLPVKQLRENTITSLDLSSKGLGVDGGLILAALIKDNTSVQQLHAQNNGLGPEGAKSFRRLLEDNSSLTLLDVSGNNMGAEGAASLAEGLKANQSVQQLHVNSNALGQAGGEAFVEALKTNKTLEEIHLGNLMVGSTVRLKSSGEVKVVTHYDSSSGITYQGKTDAWTKPSEFDPIPAVIPVKQLRENTITSLDLSSKGLGVDGGLILAALIKDNTSVQQLHAKSNRLRAGSI